MREAQSHELRDSAEIPKTHITRSNRAFVRGRSILRWIGVLYSVSFFAIPSYPHSFAVWLELGFLYAAFLFLYFGVFELGGRRQAIAFVLFFLIAFLYYPVDKQAAAVFVYPFAVLCLFHSRLRDLFLVLAGMMAGLLAETWYLGRSLRTAEDIFFYCLLLGLGNFAYAQQGRSKALLEQASSEIERLTLEAERERIARDLHDLLGHTLTVIAVKLDLARRLLSRDMERARTEIVQAEQTARNALTEVREAVSGFRGAGLDAEIGRARRNLLAADVELTTALAPVSLSSNQSDVLCLALREAVTNIVRHAHATACHVALFEQEEAIHFRIEDNGWGGPISCPPCSAAASS